MCLEPAIITVGSGQRPAELLHSIKISGAGELEILCKKLFYKIL